MERASVSQPGWAENGAFIAIVAAEALEVLRLLDAVAVGIEDAAGDDQRVARVLLEDLFGLHVEGIRVPVPNGSVDPDYPAGVGREPRLFFVVGNGRAVIGRGSIHECVPELDEEDVRAVHGRKIDRSAERDRHPGQDVEPIELVEQDVFDAFRRKGRQDFAPGRAQVDVQARVLRPIGNREQVGWKWAESPIVGGEPRLYPIFRCRALTLSRGGA